MRRSRPWLLSSDTTRLRLFACTAANTTVANQSLEHSKSAGLVFKSPKTGHGRRVDLGSIALDALRKHKLVQEQKKRWGQGYADNDLICAAPDGQLWQPDAFSSAYRTLLENNKLPTIRFLDLRHAHESS